VRGYLALCVLIVLASAFSGAGARGSMGAAINAPAFIAIQCGLAGMVLLAAHLTFFRHRHVAPVSVVAVVALGVVLALLRTVSAGAIRSAQGYEVIDAALIESTATTVVVLAVLMPALSYALATRDWYTSERVRLIARDVEIHAERLRASGAIDTAREALGGMVDSQLEASRSTAAAIRASTTPDAERMADLLMSTAQQSVRPLSHDLWTPADRPYPSMSWRQVAACEARHHPLPILVPAVGFLVVAAPLLAARTGGPSALVLAAVALTSIALVFAAGRQVIARHPQRAVPVILGALLIAPLPMVVIGMEWFGVSPAAYLPTVLLLALLVVAGGAPAAATETADATIDGLRAMVAAREVQQRALDQEHARIRRELAAHLHGTLQPRLVNASHLVREAARDGDGERLRAAMLDAETALGAIPATPPATASLDEVVDAARGEWSCLLDIAWDVQVTRNPAASGAPVADVIRESLANAVVHGHATEADVRVRERDGVLTVTITDNGIGPQRGAPGLGAELLDAATAMRWELLTREEGSGSVLIATIGA
jgi:hypothetical protein